MGIENLSMYTGKYILRPSSIPAEIQIEPTHDNTDRQTGRQTFISIEST